MSVKKNLTIATLTALLAVPAFGATNASQFLHTPSVTAHASEVTGDETTDDNTLEHITGMRMNQAPVNYHGHSFYINKGYPDVDGKPSSATNALKFALALGADGQNNSANESVSNNTGANADNKGNNSSFDNENSNSNSSTQYASKNSLPQTGENNGTSKAMALGAISLGASASLMALSFAKKHRQAEVITSAKQTVTNDNEPNDNDDSDKSIYHMIMSDTFKNLSNDLNNL